MQKSSVAKSRWLLLLLILAVNQRPVSNGRKIASDKSAFLYVFAIITIIMWLVQLTTVLNTATAETRAV